jgi:hypothetical protein
MYYIKGYFTSKYTICEGLSLYKTVKVGTANPVSLPPKTRMNYVVTFKYVK